MVFFRSKHVSTRLQVYILYIYIITWNPPTSEATVSDSVADPNIKVNLFWSLGGGTGAPEEFIVVPK